MVGSNELKESDFEIRIYFDGIINIIVFDPNNSLLNKKSNKNILTYNILCSSKSWHIIFDKLDGFIKKYNKTNYLALFCSDEN